MIIDTAIKIAGFIVLSPVLIPYGIYTVIKDEVELKNTKCSHGNPAKGRCCCGELYFNCPKKCDYCRCM